MRTKCKMFGIDNSFKHLLLLFMLSTISACGSGGDDPRSDTSPPDTSISSGPDGITNSTSASFEFSSTEAGSAFQCSLDAGAYTDCTSPETYISLAEGSHTFSVHATDAAGNTDSTPADYNWEIDITHIDITPPDTSISSGPASLTNFTSATFVFSSTESGSTLQCSLDGSAYADCSSPETYTSLAEGNHTFSVRATDAADNTDLTPADYEWLIDLGTVDNVSPNITSIVINNGAASTIVVSPLNARLVASDNVAVTDYLITEHNATDPLNVIPPYLGPLSTDINWVAITPTASVDVTVPVSLKQQYSAGDTVDLCVWFMDAVGNISNRACDSIVYGESWESGWSNWFADNGVWQVGTPTVGPASCFSGTQCAGSVLDGDYPAYTDSRLISPAIQLASIISNEEIHLRFQHWFSYSSYDSGQVQVSVWDATTSSWGTWIPEGTVVVDVSDWTLKDVDLTAYAGETVRLAFYHVAGRDCCHASESTGWYIDDIEIVTKVPVFTGNFETGIGDWSADRGLWQIGLPTAGPASCYGGSTQCIGTILDGNYPAYTDSRLVSATMTLPTVTGFEEIHLRFQHWFSYSSYDSGQVQVSVWDATTSSWGTWIPEGTVVVDVSDWTLKDVDLTAYAGETVRLAFYHVAGRDCCHASESTGWYIDDIEIVTKVPVFTGNFETGIGDWSADRGLWQIGLPTAGPASCYGGSTQCIGTILDGNYPAYTDSRLVSATMTLPTVTGFEEIHLRFQHWFSYSSYDSGQVQVSVWDAVTSTWGAWTNEGIPDVNTSGGWTQKDVILTSYAGATIRLAFYHVAGRDCCHASESTGWYIDNVIITVF